MIRPLGRTTAGISALILAVLPAAVLFSRLGWDQSQAPLFGVLVVLPIHWNRRASKSTPGIFMAWVAIMFAMIMCSVVPSRGAIL